MSSSLPWFYRFVLRNPERVEWHIERLYELGRIDAKPNLWQMSLGVAYMLHRIMFRSETIGVDDSPIRSTWGARVFQFRPMRFPFLLWQRAIDPIDLTGLSGTMERKHSHLVGAYHSGDGALYDLECMACDAPSLERLRDDVVEIMRGLTIRSRFLQDLTVYEGYHARLLALIDRAMAGDFAPDADQVNHPDTTLRGFVRWCALQPKTPEETFQAVLAGDLRFGPEARPSAG